jgi:speckle-type POZ protein
MIPNGESTWAAVSWSNQSNNYDTHSRSFQSGVDGNIRLIEFLNHSRSNRTRSYDYARSKHNIEATYQLNLEFEESKFAKGERHVLSHLSKLLETQSMADVTFIVKNEEIGAHSAIVFSASSVLSTMLEKDKFKGHTRTVEIEDMEPVVFKEMLRYLYTGRAPKMDEDEMTEPLFLAANKYQIEGLKDLCEQSLISTLDEQTIVHYLVLAHLHSAPQLLEASFKFLVEHKKEVWTRPEWKELMKSYPDLFFQASNRMIS